ncbi:hypothetical protein GGE68_003930 [Rhizobium leguminosarum]|nr:hypothetical protein [Rhizobium leguminosarum]
MQRVFGSNGTITRRRIGDDDDLIALSKLADNIIPQAAGDIRPGIDGAAFGENLDGNRRRGGCRRRRAHRDTSGNKKCGHQCEEKKNEDGR